MWWWWVFTFIHNCAWIFWFIAKNIETPKNSQNEFQWITKHVSWQDYFLHMWPTPKLDILNLLNIIFFVKWFKKWIFFLVTLSFKISKLLKFFYDLVFHQVHFMKKYFHRKGHVFIVQKIWNQLYEFMHSFLFLLKKMQFKHLI
jgi:hypothetical protein